MSFEDAEGGDIIAEVVFALVDKCGGGLDLQGVDILDLCVGSARGVRRTSLRHWETGASYWYRVVWVTSKAIASRCTPFSMQSDRHHDTVSRDAVRWLDKSPSAHRKSRTASIADRR